MKKAIAMKCTQEQFERIKPKLEGLVEFESYFKKHTSEYPFLTNYYSDKYNSIGWRCEFMFTKEEIYETWDEAIFLDACGIEPTYTITKDQVQSLHRHGNLITKSFCMDMYPDCFEVKKELVVGKWYFNQDMLFCYSGEIGNFTQKGFNKDGAWRDDLGLQEHHMPKLIEATTQEVTDALIAEAKKKYKAGDYIEIFMSSLNQGTLKKGYDSKQVSDEPFEYDSENGYLFVGNLMLYNNGVFAKVVPVKQMSQSNIEKELGYKIEIF